MAAGLSERSFANEPLEHLLRSGKITCGLIRQEVAEIAEMAGQRQAGSERSSALISANAARGRVSPIEDSLWRRLEAKRACSLTLLRQPILLDDPDGNPVELFQPAS